MASITYDGDNHAELADMLAAVKPGTRFEAHLGDKQVSFTQVIPDPRGDQRIPDRCVLRVGDTLHPNGAVSAAGDLVDYADVVPPADPVGGRADEQV